MSLQASPLLNRFRITPVIILIVALSSWAQNAKSHPWSNTNLSPDARASMVVKEMTLDEKITLLHGTGMAGLSPMSPLAVHSNGGAGYVPGIPRLGIPAIQMSDAAYGVRTSGENGRYSTALPADVAGAASWDPEAAYEYGALIGRELRAQGYNMTLGGGINLTREPRNGRTFEYLGEDPVLAGKMVGARDEGPAGAARHRRHQALRPQRSGERTQRRQRQHRQARRPRERSAGIRNRIAGIRRGRRDVLLQPRQRRLCLRKQIPAHRRAEKRLELQRLCALRLGRHAQHGESLSRRPRSRRARRNLLRRRSEEGSRVGQSFGGRAR